MKLQSQFLTLIFSFFISTVFSQTNISGGIYANTTWNQAGSPYVISGNLVIFDDVTLAIDPGVEVKFDLEAKIELRGKMTAIGSETDSIHFTSNEISPARGDWDGIIVLGTSQGATHQLVMEYVRGSYAKTFVDMDLAYRGPYVFKNSTFYDNQKVNKDGGSPRTTFEYCTFEKNYAGLTWCQFDSEVRHSTFLNNHNALEGFDLIDSCHFSNNTGIALEPYGVTNGCIIINNNIGVKGVFNAVNHTFINNVVTDNSKGVAIESYFNSANTFTGNTICNNSEYDVFLKTSNNADLSDNCWCSKDSASIRSNFVDGYVDTSYGLINFTPFDTTCQESTANEVALLEEEIQINVFPNPFTDLLLIEVESPASHRVVLIDLMGQVILDQNIKGEISLDTYDILPGVFIYTVSNKDGILKSGKVLKR